MIIFLVFVQKFKQKKLNMQLKNYNSFLKGNLTGHFVVSSSNI